MMTKTKKGIQGQAEHVNSADVVRPPASSAARLTATPALEAECQQGPEQPCDNFDMGIRELAYLKWEAAGFPQGDGFDFWVEAEREMRANQPTLHRASE